MNQGPYGSNPYSMQGYGPAPMATMQCRACGNIGAPMLVDKVTTAGWVAFGVLLVFCFPLFFIPLVWMKERKAQCSRCRVFAS